MPPLIDSPDALARGLEALTRLDPVMERLVAEGARPPFRGSQPGFEGLCWIVVKQQLSTASAEAIWRRVRGLLPLPSPDSVLAAEEAALKGAGLSAPKIRTLRALAEAVREGSLPVDALGDLPADEAHALMVAVKGIGPWTADIYLLFCLGHADAFPAGDLALQEAARHACGLEARPSPKALVALAEAWRPWRGVAAHVLWAVYNRMKQEGSARTPGAAGG